MTRFSTLRLTLLRASYLLLVVGLSLKYTPTVLGGGLESLPVMDGVVVALLSAMGLLSIAGLFSPVRMLPLLVFEIAWKAIWVIAVALPRWLAGPLDDGTAATLFACAWALPFVFIVPWGYVARTFLVSTEPVSTAAAAARDEARAS
jgi:hypothetical protein